MDFSLRLSLSLLSMGGNDCCLYFGYLYQLSIFTNRVSLNVYTVQSCITVIDI